MSPDVDGQLPRWHPRGTNNGLIFGATYHGVSRLPRRVTYPIGHVGTWLAYHLQASGRRALIENLRIVLPGHAEPELRRVALATYRNYAKDTIDFMWSLSRKPEQLRHMVGSVDTSAFESAVAGGRGVLAVSAHFGNWEMGGVLLRQLTDHALTVVVRQERSIKVNRRRNEFRASLGIETIEVRQGMETALRIRDQLQRNSVVAMLVDRHMERDRTPVTFFGRRVFFLRSPALLASFTGAPLVPVAVHRGGDGRVVIECGDPVYVTPEADREAAVRRSTQAIAEFFEARIRQSPESWYQFYPYWAAQDVSGQDGERPNHSEKAN
jgi:KDO2-lipid IV(A) lauroyltransferase